MAYMKKVDLVKELEGLGIEVNYGMPVAQLQEMLALHGGKTENKVSINESELQRTYKTIPCGITAINDHERRITDLEYEIKELKSARTEA